MLALMSCEEPVQSPFHTQNKKSTQMFMFLLMVMQILNFVYSRQKIPFTKLPKEKIGGHERDYGIIQKIILG